MPKLRLIGDVHGHMHDYVLLAHAAEYSIQLGDLGFNYKRLADLDPERHKVLGGNHDNYEEVDGVFVNQTPHFLGDFGTYSMPDFLDIFFVRGGYSIDKMYRRLGVDWWPAEELNYAQMVNAMKAYIDSKPDFVVTHECPESIIPEVSTLKLWDGKPIVPSSTARLLDEMLKTHRPKVWVFGHHHKTWSKEIDGTQFICLAELEEMDIDYKLQ